MIDYRRNLQNVLLTPWGMLELKHKLEVQQAFLYFYPIQKYQLLKIE